ncbi:MAG TPA: right-handed parallel beta-helix repeat-containing protein [Candidatus Dormibacteraeota bacterium]|nr:right-handed parallel beta-helix repeat-containing protein [Candidatus Dormibacteraeota bacterium]
MAAVPLLAAASLLAVPSPVHAAGTTWTVLTTADDTGTVACLTPAHTCVTLRDAINQASSDVGDTISLGAHTYTLSTCTGVEPDAGALEIDHDMTIRGQGSAKTTIAGGTCLGAGAWDNSLIVTCNSPALTVDGVTLTGGYASNSSPSDSGTGGAINEGGISFCDPSNLSLTMNDVDVFQNKASGNGGGIYTSGANVSLTNVTFSHNRSLNETAGAMYFSGANTLSMLNVYAHDNSQSCDCNTTSFLGGGAFRIIDTSTTAGTATNILIEHNTANGFTGGGVLQEGAGTVDWNNVTLDGNSAPNDFGGGMYLTDGTTAKLTNVTATNNTAKSWGGAFGVGLLIAPSTLTIRAGTISGNSVTASGGGGAIFTNSGPTTITQTILHNNLANGALNECTKALGGTIASGGYNLGDDTSCALSKATDTQNAAKDPLLGSLATNSVSSGIPPVVGAGADSKALSTEALGTGSPAIDVVPGSFCPPPATDERGVTRPQGAGCEIGAFEVQVVAVPVPVPTTGAVPAGPVSGLGYVLLVIGGLLGACVVGAPLRRRRHPTH